MTYVVMGILFVVLLSLLSLGVRAVDSLERENRLAEAEIEASRIYQKSLETRVEEVRRYRHDADGLLRAVEQVMRSEDMAAGEFEESSGMQGFSDDRMSLSLARAAVDLHVRQCAESDIAFECEVANELPALASERDVGETDLCIVLQNLLDNAFEENEGIPLEPGTNARYMSLRMGEDEQGRLRIAVSNRTASSAPPVLRTQKANPELHGVGLRAIEDIAHSHSGSVESSFDAESRMFTVTVVL